MIRRLALCCLVLLAAAPVLAGHEGSIHFQLASPVGEFADHVDDVALGLNMDWTYSGDGPLALGLGGDFLIYGHNTVVMDLPLVEDFEYVTDNNMASLFAIARLKASEGFFQPYVEARFGWSYIWTETKLEDEDWWDDDEVARETNFDDFALIWGGGAGLRLMLHEADPRDEESKDVMLDMRVIYRRGACADYLTEGAIVVEADDSVHLEPSRSRTDLVQYMLGVTIGF